MRLNITVDERTFEVDVEAAEPESPVLPYSVSGLSLGSAPLRVPAAAPVPATPVNGGAVNEDKVCRSPVSGIVVRVAAQIGQSLQKGDILVVLEAMKMETNITAPAPGKIKAIAVNQGESVQAGQLVVEFE